MARWLHRPSPALVVACIALFVALSGFGYAAIKLPRNSVGTKQLKNSAVTGKKIAKRAVSGAKIAPNAVTGDKVADNSLTGADVLESSLGRVPSATNATNATNANTVGGLAPSVFARASRFYVGAGNPTAALRNSSGLPPAASMTPVGLSRKWISSPPMPNPGTTWTPQSQSSSTIPRRQKPTEISFNT